MSFQICVGPSQYDVVRYCRALTEDLNPPYIIPDESYQAYAEDAVEDFSRHIPLDFVVGNPFSQSSPLVTVRGQQRYVCSTANGFVSPPMHITDVVYAAGTGFSVASEIAYMALLPFSPITRFLTSPNILDSPSERVLRDAYIEELTHYGKGYYTVVRDPATGMLAIDLYPTPQIAATPIYVRYQGGHQLVADTHANLSIPTIPEDKKREFAKLLYVTILEQEGDRIVKSKSARAGLIEQQADTRIFEERINRIKTEVYGSLGAYTGVILASHS